MGHVLFQTTFDSNHHSVVSHIHSPSNPQNILDIIEKQARALLAENSPSTYALISQLFEIITQANKICTHRIIRAHLNRAGKVFDVKAAHSSAGAKGLIRNSADKGQARRFFN